MKKTIISLLCGLCFLAAVPAYAQTNEVAAATEVVKAYYDMSIKGDVKGSFQYMTKEYRAETEELLAANEGLLELGTLLLQKTEYEIVAVEPDGKDMLVDIVTTMPDMDQLFLKASGGLDPNLGEEEFTDALIKNAIELLKKETFPLAEDEVAMILIKEDGQWKIDDEI